MAELRYSTTAVRSRRRTHLTLGAIGSLVAAVALVGAVAAQSAPSGDITYWHHFTSENEMLGLDQAEQGFEAINPGVTVTSETVPNPDYMTKIVTAVQSDQRPDTAMVAEERLPDMAAMGALVPLTDRVKAWEGYGDYSEGIWNAITYDGEIYGVPAFAFVDVLFYRADWFAEAGIEPPTTWEELEAAAIKVTDPANGRYGFALRAGAGGAYWLMSVMESFGAKWVDENGQPALDRDIVVESLGFYTGLLTEHGAAPPSAAEDGYAQTANGFKTGQTAMLFQSTGALGDLVTDLTVGDQMAAAQMPIGVAGPSARVSALYNGMMSDKNADASWAWLTHWGEVDTQLEFMKATGYFPPSTSAQQDPFITEDPILSTAAEAAASGVPTSQFVGLPAFQSEVLLPALQEVLTGQKTVEEAADDIIAGLAESVG